MKAFAQLMDRLDRDARETDQSQAIEDYLRSADPADASWAVRILTHPRSHAAAARRQLIRWAAEESGLPDWIIQSCHRSVGDISETIALLLPAPEAASSIPLHVLMIERYLPLAELPLESRRKVIVQTWLELSPVQRWIWNNMVMGVSPVWNRRSVVVMTLARMARTTAATMHWRLLKDWPSTIEGFQRLLRPLDERENVLEPCPFLEPRPLETELRQLGPIEEWQCEWAWDGLRAQLLHMQGRVLVWSFDQQELNLLFPELAEACELLPDATVLDGNIMVLEGGRPGNIARLKQRLAKFGRRSLGRSDRRIIFMAADLLVVNGSDIRDQPLRNRRQMLVSLVESLALRAKMAVETARPGMQMELELFPEANPVFTLAPIQTPAVIEIRSWDRLEQAWNQARSLGVRGLELRHYESSHNTQESSQRWWFWPGNSRIEDSTML